jgi:LAO/AO transport system kinase
MAQRENSIELALEGLRGAVRAEVARVLNAAEDARPEARAWIRSLLGRLRRDGAFDRAHRVGITGPPGVGKSMLVAAITRALRKGGAPRTVGILAVDPSSIRSGGALLGDRVRIALDPKDEGVFLRSLATSGELGGLARSVPVSVLLLSAAFDVVLVETVGIGQSETDVRHVVDTVVFVVQPGSGDALQYLKAGVMEVPNVIVVNKADHAETARATAREVGAAVASLRAAGIGDAEPPVFLTSARDGTGVEILVEALGDRRTALAKAGALETVRRQGTIAWALRAFVRAYGEVGVTRAGGERAVAAEIAARVDAGDEVLGIVDALAPYD